MSETKHFLLTRSLVRMIHQFWTDALSQGNLEQLNLLQLYILIPLGIIIVVYLLRLLYVFSMKDKGSPEQQVKLNCWFCNEDVTLPSAETESWTCPHCQQYNGFTKDGDYSQPVQEQFDIKDYKTQTVCSASEFNTAKSVLCEACSQNQVLKVRQLATFTPFCEASYDDEVGRYKDYLENRYSLCDICSCKVDHYLTTQDKKLTSAMKDEHLSLLDRLKNKCQQTVSDHMEQVKTRQPVMSRLMFSLCACSSLVYVTLGWTHSTTSNSQNKSYFNQTVKLCLSFLPDWLILLTEQASLVLGTVFCNWGLLLAGKHSLYPEDAVHLLMWLLLIVLACDLPAMSWLCLTKERCVWIRAGTLLLSFICCLKNRLPRHLTAVTIQKKHINQLDLSARESAHDLSTRCKVDSKVVDTADTSLSSPHLQSISPDKNNGSLQFENIQQNLECLSLGLAKKSGSSSSIWSLPTIVATADSNTSPDSTTDRPAQRIQKSAGVLSPSRLGFLCLDSVLKDGQYRRSSSFSSLQASGDNLYTQINQTRAQHPGLSSNYDSVLQPEPRRLSSCTSFPSSVLSFDVPSNIGPCDSQTTDNSHIQLFDSSIGLERHQIGHIPRSEINSWRSAPKQNKMSSSRSRTRKLEVPAAEIHHADYMSQNSGPRRSQRIAMSGKSPKPWSLKKSLSCNNIGNWQTLQESKFWGVTGIVVPKCVGSDTFGSIPRSNLLPVQEVTNSRVYQKTTRGSRPTCRNCLPNGQGCRHCFIPGNSLSEFSDDEYEESNNFENKTNTSKRQKTTDLPWTWMFVGILMGASLTTNIFLLCQGWWFHGEWLAHGS